MSNLVVVARNEFANLMRSKLVLFIVAVYLVLLVYTLVGVKLPGDSAYSITLSYYHVNSSNSDTDYFVGVLLRSLSNILTFYGAFLGIILGVYTIAIERYGNTLNILVVKPLYRDTIINGKLLGSIIFLVCIFLLTIFLFIAGITILWGSEFSWLVVGFLLRVPFVAFFDLLYVLFFFAISLLISLVVRDLAFSLILGMTFRMFLGDVPTIQIAGKLQTLIGSDLAGQIVDLTPNAILSDLFKTPLNAGDILKPSVGLPDALLSSLPDMFKLCLYVVVFVVFSYIVFVRSDVS